jgi:DNA-binding PadR family transcriptional regulator
MILLSRSEEIILLAIWKLRDNAYGVTIKDQVSDETGHEWSFGAIYKPLKKLVHKNFIKKNESNPIAERGGRTKFLYTLTPEGMEALKEIKKINDKLWNEETKFAFEK